MFFKIQTWFPYNVQLYLNGREYLSRMLPAEEIAYSMYTISFLHNLKEDFHFFFPLRFCTFFFICMVDVLLITLIFLIGTGKILRFEINWGSVLI